MATENPEGETLNGRLQLFLSSVFSSLGGVFGHREESEMASRAAVVPKQPRGKFPIDYELGLFCFDYSMVIFCWFYSFI